MPFGKKWFSEIASGGGSSGSGGTQITLRQGAVLGAALLSSAFGMPSTGIPKRPIGPSLAQILQPEVLKRYACQPGMLDRLAEYLPESQRWQINFFRL